MEKRIPLWKKNLFFLMFLGIGLGIFLQRFPSQATKTSDLEDQREEILEEIDDLKQEITDSKEEIDGIKVEKEGIQQFISQLDQQEASLMEKITAFEGEIAEKETQITETQAALEEAEEECALQYEKMKKRIQYMYENSSNTSMLVIFLGSSDLSEFLNRVDEVSALSDYDQRMMEELRAQKEEVENYKLQLQAEKEELEIMRQSLESERAKVDQMISSKRNELAAKQNELEDASEEKKEYEKKLEEQEKLLSQIEDQIAENAKGDAYQGTVSGFMWPCPGYTRISSYFGPRKQPVAGASTNHKGVDLAAPYGTAILASASGVVTTSKYSNSAGNYIVVSHGNGVSTVYMHASRLLVSVGETVEQGQKIAEVGSTGYSSGNHLHFGVIKNGTYVDPLGYVSP